MFKSFSGPIRNPSFIHAPARLSKILEPIVTKNGQSHCAQHSRYNRSSHNEFFSILFHRNNILSRHVPGQWNKAQDPIPRTLFIQTFEPPLRQLQRQLQEDNFHPLSCDITYTHCTYCSICPYHHSFTCLFNSLVTFQAKGGK